jgi:hypothetical protein
MIKKSHSRRSVWIVLVFLIATPAAVGQTADPELVRLRLQLAVNYLEPWAHMALAKYYWQKGDRLQAFYLAEYARRDRFPEAQFNLAFHKAFGDKAKLPPNKRGEAAFKKGIELQKAGDDKQAEEAFVQAAELSPDSVTIQAWVGRFLFKVRRNDERALPYYLNAYFLDPHAYETEFVESRIRTINWDAANLRFRQLMQRGTALQEIVRDANPTVVVAAIEALSSQWRPEYLKPFLECMNHDDETIRWQATLTIQNNVDRSFDETLKRLLTSSDLRIQGLAAYIAVHLWKQQSFDVIRRMLREDAQLLRFDAISALAREGGSEGRRIMLAHRRYERHPVLIQMIDSDR